MAILNPVVSNFTITSGSVQEVYMCPTTKTNAIIDLTLLKEDTSQDSVLSFALATNNDPSTLTTIDYFIDDLVLPTNANSSEINKLVVGQGERLYVKLTSGPDVNIRVSGVEDNNPKVLKAGRLTATAVADTTETQIYENTLSNVSYISCSITIFNKSTTDDADIEVWFSTSTTPSAADKVLKLTLPKKTTTVLENILLKDNEKIIAKSSVANTEYFINGMVIGT